MKILEQDNITYGANTTKCMTKEDEKKVIELALSILNKKFTDKKNPIERSQDLIDRYRIELSTQHYESFVIVALDQTNRVIAEVYRINGLLNRSLIDVKEIVRSLLNIKTCASCICLHNHPSGDTTPSQLDTDMTRKLKDALKLFDYRLLDHIIVGTGGYYSYVDEGIMP